MKPLTKILDHIHPYPFYVMVVCLYLAILMFALCGVVMWFPQILQYPHTYFQIGRQLFELGHSLIAVGGITAPIMDLILHHDIDQMP